MGTASPGVSSMRLLRGWGGVGEERVILQCVGLRQMNLPDPEFFMQSLATDVLEAQGKSRRL